MAGNKHVLSIFRQGSTVTSLLCNKYRLFCVNKQATDYCIKKFSTQTTPSVKSDWNQAVSEAEKVVGYPTSFLSLRWLLNDEVANVALHLQKLVGSTHPLIKTAKSLIYNEHNNMQTWGLIVLLVSKAAGRVNQQNNFDDVLEEETTANILHRQRALAEVTEMIRTGHLVHRGLVNFLRSEHTSLAETNDMTFGNKIALLSGDYLLVTSCAKLASIKNHALLELMSCALRDLSESAFIGRRDRQNNPLPSVPRADCTNYAVKEWTLLNFLGSGSLLGKSCKGTLILAGHNEEMQLQAYDFGKHLALAWQAAFDLGPFIKKDRTTPFNLCSAPVIFHVEHDPSILIEIDKGLESVNNIDYAKIYDIVIDGPGIELTKQLHQEHSQCAMEILNIFEESDARTALSNIVVSTRNY